MKIFELNQTLTMILDFSLWPLIHIIIGYIGARIPSKYFERDAWPYKKSAIEMEGKLYNFFGIKRWKSILPDGARLVDRNGFPKKKLASLQEEYIEKFIIETRRAEFVHLIHLPFLIIFFLFNPLFGDIIMIIYAFFMNVPCIFAQRYNRIRLMKVLDHMKGVKS